MRIRTKNNPINKKKKRAQQHQSFWQKLYLKFCCNKTELVVFSFSALMIWAGLTNYQLYQVAGSSMTPTLEDQQLLVVNKHQKPKRYDIVVFQRTDEYYVKRVIGMPGDQVLFINEQLYIQMGEYHSNGLYSLQVSEEVQAVLLAEGVIPTGCYFVIGDNVDNSMDSRSLGLVKQAELLGIIPLVLF